MVDPISGSYAAIVRSEVEDAKLALAEVNAKGGIKIRRRSTVTRGMIRFMSASLHFCVACWRKRGACAIRRASGRYRTRYGDWTRGRLRASDQRSERRISRFGSAAIASTEAPTPLAC